LLKNELGASKKSGGGAALPLSVAMPLPAPAVLAAAGAWVDGDAEASASSCIARAGAGWWDGGRGAGDSRTGDVGDRVGDGDANRAAMYGGAGAGVGRQATKGRRERQALGWQCGVRVVAAWEGETAAAR